MNTTPTPAAGSEPPPTAASRPIEHRQPTAPPEKRHVFRKILAIAVAVIAVGALSLGIVNTVTLNHKVTVLKQTAARQSAKIVSLNDQVNLLQPLTTYSQGCSQQQTDSFGNPTETVYYPCSTTGHP